MPSVASDSLASLRQELKTWEQAFFAQNGRKPSRDDIKNDRQIAERYRTFNKLRTSQNRANACSVTPTKPRVSRDHIPGILAEKSVNINAGTPKRSVVSTPRKAISFTEPQLPSPTPVHIRYALGPTPQKDGHVLGLFDASPGVVARVSSGSMGDHEDHAIASTPSDGRRRLEWNERHSRTPQSSGKRFFLDAFAGTPLKRKRDMDDIGTPVSIKRTFATPAFLRRVSTIEFVNDDRTNPKRAVSRKKRGPVRSLSSIIANLRKNENERMDEEWEIMEEMEAGANYDDNNDDDNHDAVDDSEIHTVAQAVQHPAKKLDLHVPDMPLGPDRLAAEGEDDASEDEHAVRKPWKKKGLKRQTKRTNMKPVLHEPKKAAEFETEGIDTGMESHIIQQPKGDEPGIVKKALRKVNEAAHMNFRRLKIKNKNSKAGGRGRFGRR